MGEIVEETEIRVANFEQIRESEEFRVFRKGFYARAQKVQDFVSNGLESIIDWFSKSMIKISSHLLLGFYVQFYGGKCVEGQKTSAIAGI